MEARTEPVDRAENRANASGRTASGQNGPGGVDIGPEAVSKPGWCDPIPGGSGWLSSRIV